MVSQTVTRKTPSLTVSAAAARIALLVLALLSCSSAANAPIEWRISVKVFVDRSDHRLCLLEPDDCGRPDCCYNTDQEIRDMFLGADSPLPFLNERGITIGQIDVLELHHDELPDVPEGLRPWFDHYCVEGTDDDGPCHPDDDDPCPGSGVCVERPVDHYCDNAGDDLGPCDPAAPEPCPDGGTCVEEPRRWYHAWVRKGHVTRTLRDYAHEDQLNRFCYDPEAVNVYLFPTYFGGRCACDPWDGPDPRAILVIGHGKNRTVMGLCHTQGCQCGDCVPNCDGGDRHGHACDVDADCPGGTCDVVKCVTEPGDDHMADTLPDLQCWEPNDIAQYSFGVDYDEATSSQQEQVDNVYYNVISYHGESPPRLTSDQFDRMMDVSGTTWFAITQRCTFFVDGDPDVPPTMIGHLNCSREGPRPNVDGDEYPDTKLDGSSVNPLSTVASALNEAGDGDIVMIRGGYYDEQLTIDQPVFLRASMGNAVIGMTGP
jgi:hypothetical protein